MALRNLKEIGSKALSKTSEARPLEPQATPLPDVIRRNSMANTLLALIAVAAALHYGKLVCIVVCLSVLLAFVLEPLVKLLERIRLPRSVAALLALLVLFAALYGVSMAFYNRAVTFSEELPRFSAELRHSIVKYTDEFRRITDSARAAVPEPNKRQPVPVVQQTSMLDAISSGLGTATEVAFSVSFIPFLAYFMLNWKDHARRSTVLLFPKDNRQTAYSTLGTMADMIRGFIIGNLLVGLFISAVSTAVFGLLGIPYFYFIGFISGFLSLVPYLGVLLALLPPVLSGVGVIHATGFLFVFLTVLALHLFSLNVLYPKFIGRRLQLNPLAVTLALLFWGWIWGAMGLILAIPMTAAMKIVFDHVESLSAYGAWLGE